jgi:hypothetical protein
MSRHLLTHMPRQPLPPSFGNYGGQAGSRSSRYPALRRDRDSLDIRPRYRSGAKIAPVGRSNRRGVIQSEARCAAALCRPKRPEYRGRGCGKPSRSRNESGSLALREDAAAVPIPALRRDRDYGRPGKAGRSWPECRLWLCASAASAARRIMVGIMRSFTFRPAAPLAEAARFQPLCSKPRFTRAAFKPAPALNRTGSVPLPGRPVPSVPRPLRAREDAAARIGRGAPRSAPGVPLPSASPSTREGSLTASGHHSPRPPKLSLRPLAYAAAASCQPRLRNRKERSMA